MLSKLVFTAPKSQLQRVQVIASDFVAGNIANAAFTALVAARETKDSHNEWSALCAEFVVSQMRAMEAEDITKKMPFVAALVDFAGQQLRSEKIMIDQAVFISSVALSNGDNQLQALHRARTFLNNNRGKPCNQE